MNGIKEIIIFVIIFIIMLAINALLFLLAFLMRPMEEKKHCMNKQVIWAGCLIPVMTYLALNILSTCGKVIYGLEKDYYMQNIIIERGGAAATLLAYIIVKLTTFIGNYSLKIKNPFPYAVDSDGKSEKYYIDIRYKKCGKDLQIVALILCFLFSFGQAIFVYNNYYYFSIYAFIKEYGCFLMMAMIYLTVYEIGVFLDGELHPDALSRNNIIAKEDMFIKMLIEYKDKFRDYLLLYLNKDENFKEDGGIEKDDYIYSKIFTPIIEGKNIIVETENICMLNDIIPPLLYLIFGTNRKMLFITESDAESNATYKWLRDCNVLTDNIKYAVQVYTEDDDRMMLPDNNIDIFIGTVDKLLENREVTKYADTIFSINIDNIIVDSPIELSILTKVLSMEKNKNIQYILFANEVNGLQQSIESVFYTEDFLYQVVRQKLVKNFYSMFFAKEKGWIQKPILPSMAGNLLGAALPLLVTPIKYGFEKLFAISNAEAYEDEKISLHKCAPYLKTYVGNTKVNDIEDKIKFLPNEHFVENSDSMIVAYDDSENNLILLLNNYIKYASSRILVNIVSGKYLLRDYMIDNIDFFMQNHDYIGKIVPYHKDGKKILLFKLINELCLNGIEEEQLIHELNKLNNRSFNPTDINNTESYIKESFIELIEEVFNKKMYLDAYLSKDFYSQSCGKKRYAYRLSNEIKMELPRNLFTQIKFVTSEKKYKQLKNVPLYEMYQNYAVGQYVEFDGKSYVIDNINDREGIVTLIYNNHMSNTTYRQKKDVEILKINGVERSENVNNFGNLKYEKKIINLDAKVIYEGYYEFANGLNFNQQFYKYQSNNLYGSPVTNNYYSQKAFVFSFEDEKIKKLNAEEKLKVAETLAFLLNEIAKTIYYGANQYLIIRAITRNNLQLSGEVNDLYSPINIQDCGEGIEILVMEDTELEKGILDSFTIKLDTTIIPLVTDYLEWVLDEAKDLIKEEQIEKAKYSVELNDIYVETYNKDKIIFYNNEKMEFLKLGKDNITEYFDLKTALYILNSLNIEGSNSLTSIRKDFIERRTLVNEVEEDEAEAKENEIIESETIKNEVVESKKEENKTIENVKEEFSESENKVESKEDENVVEEKKENTKKTRSSKKNVVNDKYDYSVGKNVKKEEIVQYLENNIYDPIINSEKEIGDVRNTILSIKKRINSDKWNEYAIVNYVLHLVESTKGKNIYKKLKAYDLPCIEDNINEFMQMFEIKKN